MRSIATLTVNASIDKSAGVDHVVPERKLRCDPPVREPGGGGINVSRAIHNLGGQSLAVYTSGGITGQMLQGLLDQAGIQHDPVLIEGLTRESLTILEQSTGQQFRFGMPGPDLREEEWRACLDEFDRLAPRPDYLVASGSLPPGVPGWFYAELARRAKSSGSRIVVDTSGEALRAAVDEGVFLVKPNLRELGQLAGREFEGENDIRSFATEMVEKGGAEVVVVSMGAAGALLVTAQEFTRLRAPTVPIKSKIGAGDSMVAGMVLGLARDWSLLEAVRYGVAAGAAAVMTPGTQLCRREDTDRLYARIGGDAVEA